MTFRNAREIIKIFKYVELFCHQVEKAIFISSIKEETENRSVAVASKRLQLHKRLKAD